MRPIKLSFFISLILLLFTACSTSVESENVSSKSEEITKVSVRAMPVKKRDMTIFKTYFGQVNFKQSTTVMAEMPGTVQSVKWKLGQKVNKDQVLISYPRPEDNLDIENKGYDQAKIAYDELKKNYERQLILLEKGAVSKVSVEQLKSQMEVQEKVMDQLQLGIKKSYTLKAPYSGIITDVHVQAGQQLAPGTPLFSIANQNQLEVEFFVLAEDANALHIGKQIQIIDEQDSTTASISAIAPQIDPIRRALRVVAVLDNIDGQIYTGSTVQISLMREEVENAIVLPEEAILNLGQEHFVYVAKGNNAVARKVELGQRNGLDVIINRGIEEGDMLITAGMGKLKNNTPISIIR